MEQEGTRESEDLGEDYCGWPLRQRLELLAFDARLAAVPQELLEALWEAINNLGKRGAARAGRLRAVRYRTASEGLSISIGEPAHTSSSPTPSYSSSTWADASDRIAPLSEIGWGKCAMMETIREARLRREAADRYPFIPVRMWTQAARMADLVRKHLEGCGRRVRARRRALAEGDFRFRGGLRHSPGAHTRLTDPEPAATAPPS